MKEYWLTCNPETFIWLQHDSGLIYNCENQRSFRFKTNDQIEKICLKLLVPESLYSVKVTEEINEPLTKLWIESLTSKKLASLSESNGVNCRPVSYCPMLKIQRDRELIIEENNNGTGGRIIENLHEITFYINGSKTGSEEYFKQMLYPLKSENWLMLSTIQTLLKSCNIGMLHKITIVGDLINYPELKKLLAYLPNIQILINFVILLKDVIGNLEHLKSFQRNLSTISLIITDNSSIYSAYSFFKEHSFTNIVWIFPISDEKWFFSVMEEINKYQIENYEIIPIFNSKNSSFFEKYVYLCDKDFEDIKLTKKEIFTNMAMNSNWYGKLYILPDGKIYSNVNSPALGTVDNSIYEILYKEFSSGNSWFNIRNKKPCNKCLYQWLCPPPSNYELLIGKNNLCLIKHNF